MLEYLVLAASTVIVAAGFSGDVTVTEAEKQQISPMISQSEDYLAHKDEFDTAAAILVKMGRCTPDELQEMGGWWKSVSHKPKPVYFTYCGGMTVANRIYVDTSTREIFK